jgi:hypothetical protein
LFAIDVAAVEVAAALTAGSYSITVEVDTGFGAPFSRSFLITVTEAEIGPTPGTPVLTWTSDATDLTPDGTVSFDNVPVEGDIITSQIQVAGGDWSVLVVDNSRPITADEDLWNEVDLSNSDLPPGSYDWRVRITHNSAPSDWSNVETKTLTGFSPADLSPAAWFEARNGVFQTVDGSTTAASANSDPVGYLPDLSGNAFHVTATANDTTRPTLQGVGVKPYLSFDGSNDVLRRTASLGSYAAGAFTWAVVIRGSAPAAAARIMAEGNSASANDILSCFEGTAGSTGGKAFWRENDGVGPTGVPNGSTAPNIANVFDGNDHVMLCQWDGTTITWYKDGVSAETMSPAAGTFILDRFALGALVRNSTGSNWLGRLYGAIAINRVLTSTERANLTTYLGNLAGLSL